MTTLEEIKKSRDFDEVVSDLIARRVSQDTELDLAELVEEVKAKVNARMRQVASSWTSPDEPED